MSTSDGVIRGLFTIRPYNPVSVAIRCATPVSLTMMAPASHVIAVDGDYAIEANMLHGVRRVPLSEAIAGAKVVSDVEYRVPNARNGLEWMRWTAEQGIPYDWPGAFGLGLAPDREWQKDDAYFCFEHFGTGLVKAGRPIFINNAHVNARMLMSLIP